MTAKELSEHDLVLVQARVYLPMLTSRSALLFVPTHNGEDLLPVPFTKIYLPQASENAARAAMVMLEQMQALHADAEEGARVQWEQIRRMRSGLEGLGGQVVAEVQEVARYSRWRP